MKLPDIFVQKVESRVALHAHDPLPSVSGPGRSLKSFEEAGIKTKRKIVRSLTTEFSQKELVLPTQMTLHSAGKRDAASLLRNITATTPRRATKYKRSYEIPAMLPVPFTPDEALAYFINNNFSKRQYVNTRLENKKRQSDIYSSYNILLKAKEACYPSKENTEVTELSAEVDHTINRLVSVQIEVLQSVKEPTPESLNIVFKWGCDGSSAHIQYKQAFQDEIHDSQICLLFQLYPCRCIITMTIMTKYYSGKI